MTTGPHLSFREDTVSQPIPTDTRRRSNAGILLGLLVFFYADSALAQTTPAMLFGTIVDAQDQVVPGAMVVLRSIDSGRMRITSSDDEGRFRLIGLPSGPYEFRAALAGFEPFAAAVRLV